MEAVKVCVYGGWVRSQNLNRTSRQGLLEKVRKHNGHVGKNIPGRENTCKGPAVGACPISRIARKPEEPKQSDHGKVLSGKMRAEVGREEGPGRLV